MDHKIYVLYEMEFLANVYYNVVRTLIKTIPFPFSSLSRNNVLNEWKNKQVSFSENDGCPAAWHLKQYLGRYGENIFFFGENILLKTHSATGE